MNVSVFHHVVMIMLSDHENNTSYMCWTTMSLLEADLILIMKCNASVLFSIYSSGELHYVDRQLALILWGALGVECFLVNEFHDCR